MLLATIAEMKTWDNRLLALREDYESSESEEGMTTDAEISEMEEEEPLLVHNVYMCI